MEKLYKITIVKVNFISIIII